ncbi:MAG: TIM barrel protein [Novosphingobium sp.]|nr:sugar phosphate isomerase/epimerase [Novosphingobium sp.]
MDRLGIENLSTFGLHPVEFIRLAGELGCGHVSLNLSGSANRLDIYPEVSWRGDVALQRDMARAADDAGVAISLVEGFAILPGAAADFFADLDHAAAMGAKAICAVSLERDITRTHDEFARLTDLAAQRGIVTTTEVGAGVLRNLEKSLAAVAAVAHSGFRLLVDTMHFFRSGSTLADFAALDPAAIGHIQLCDVPMPAQIESYMEEALYERRAPGDGDLPLAELVKLVPEEVAIGLEIPIRSEAEAGVGPMERLGRCVSAARRLMEAR